MLMMLVDNGYLDPKLLEDEHAQRHSRSWNRCTVRSRPRRPSCWPPR